MADDEKKGGGMLGIIFLVIAIGAGIGYAVYRQKTDIPDEITEAQKDPQKALDMYLKHAYGFAHQTSNFGPLERLSTKDDWEWFQANYDSLHFDALSLSTSIDPGQAAAAGKTLAMMQLINAGASRPGPIFRPQIGENDASFSVKIRITDDPPHEYADYRVKLLKEGNKWKVVGFAGGRAAAEKTRAKDDVIISEHRDYAANADGSRGELLPGAKPPPTPAAAGAVAGKPGPAAPAKPGQPIVAPAKPGMPAVAPAAAAPPASTGVTKVADDTLKKAADAWEAGNYELSLKQAQSALAMYERLLAPNDPKIGKVKGMIAAAERQIATAPPKPPPPPPPPAAQPAQPAAAPVAAPTGADTAEEKPAGDAKPKNPWKK